MFGKKVLCLTRSQILYFVILSAANIAAVKIVVEQDA